MNKQPNQQFEEDYFTTTHNIEANEETKDLEKYYIQDAIGSTLFSKSWLLSTLSNLNTENSESTSKEEEDLESISEMSCDDQIAKYLGTEANAQFKLLSLLLPQCQSSFRIQELALVILSNILRYGFDVFRYESTCLDIPLSILNNQEFSHHPDFIQVLVSLFQYLTIFNDFLAESDDFDEEKDFINHNFELLPQVLTIMASTLNEDVLAKTARYLFSVLELASETSDPMAKIGQLLSPQALGYLNEALKQSLDNRDDKTSFIIVELCAALFDFIDNSEDILESDQSHQFCDTINRHLSCENPPELTSVKSCAKICSILWTNACHVDSFEQISRHYLAENHCQEGQEVILDVIKKCLKYFLTLHSNALLSSSEVLNSPIINEIVQLLATV